MNDQITAQQTITDYLRGQVGNIRPSDLAAINVPGLIKKTGAKPFVDYRPFIKGGFTVGNFFFPGHFVGKLLIKEAWEDSFGIITSGDERSLPMLRLILDGCIPYSTRENRDLDISEHRANHRWSWVDRFSRLFQLNEYLDENNQVWQTNSELAPRVQKFRQEMNWQIAELVNTCHPIYCSNSVTSQGNVRRCLLELDEPEIYDFLRSVEKNSEQGATPFVVKQNIEAMIGHPILDL